MLPQLPDDDNPEQNPLNYEHIREQQQADRKLLDLHRRYPQNYFYKSLTDDALPTYVKGLVDKNYDIYFYFVHHVIRIKVILNSNT